MNYDLSTRDIKYLPGVGPKRAGTLNKELGVFSFRDLLYTFPYKYVDRSRLYSISEIDGNMPYIQLKGQKRQAALMHLIPMRETLSYVMKMDLDRQRICLMAHTLFIRPRAGMAENL